MRNPMEDPVRALRRWIYCVYPEVLQAGFKMMMPRHCYCTSWEVLRQIWLKSLEAKDSPTINNQGSQQMRVQVWCMMVVASWILLKRLVHESQIPHPTNTYYQSIGVPFEDSQILSHLIKCSRTLQTSLWDPWVSQFRTAGVICQASAAQAN